MSRQSGASDRRSSSLRVRHVEAGIVCEATQGVDGDVVINFPDGSTSKMSVENFRSMWQEVGGDVALSEAPPLPLEDEEEPEETAAATPAPAETAAQIPSAPEPGAVSHTHSASTEDIDIPSIDEDIDIPSIDEV